LFTGYSCLATGLVKNKNYTQKSFGIFETEITIKVIGISYEKRFPLLGYTYTEHVKLDESATSVTLERFNPSDVFTASYYGEEDDYLIYKAEITLKHDIYTGCSRTAFNTFTTNASSSEEFENATDYRWIPGTTSYNEPIILNLYHKKSDSVSSKAATCSMFLDYIKMLFDRFFK
jgi:hypothetical protein